MTTETLISIFLGVGLAASVGFRVFLPLFLLSLAAYTGMWELNQSWVWLGSLASLIVFGVAMLVEILAYYIPWLDNLLDTIAVPLAGIAGTAVVVSTAVNMDPVILWSLGIIAGGGTASVIKGTTSTTRLGSTAATAGFANPLISTVETGSSLLMSLISIFIPVLAIFLVLVILGLVYLVYRKFRRFRN